tara:strand:- start:6908 stop:7126 length:219 start_codon:yes stop_codon:yes gene_type:complete
MSNKEDEEEFFISGPRDYDEQTDSFRMDLENLIYRYIDEYDINTFVMVGALQEKIQELLEEGNTNMDIELDE